MTDNHNCGHVPVLGCLNELTSFCCFWFRGDDPSNLCCQCPKIMSTSCKSVGNKCFARDHLCLTLGASQHSPFPESNVSTVHFGKAIKRPRPTLSSPSSPLEPLELPEPSGQSGQPWHLIPRPTNSISQLISSQQLSSSPPRCASKTHRERVIAGQPSSSRVANTGGRQSQTPPRPCRGSPIRIPLFGPSARPHRHHLRQIPQTRRERDRAIAGLQWQCRGHGDRELLRAGPERARPTSLAQRPRFARRRGPQCRLPAPRCLVHRLHRRQASRAAPERGRDGRWGW